MPTIIQRRPTLSLLVLLAAAFAVGWSGVAAANYYDQDWTSEMNQTSYWSPWQCTKYDGHGGWIPAEYDAAIIKAGQKVRVYPDLTSTGAFQASAPDGKDISWVMKCKHPTQPTTTTSTTSTSTTSTTSTSSTTSTTSPSTTSSTVPASTTTTLNVPSTTSPTQSSTTSVAPSSSVPGSTSTTTSTAPGTTTTTTDAPSATTTIGTPSSTSPGTVSFPDPTDGTLPETGSEHVGALALVALVLMAVGGGAALAARRR